MRPGVVHKAALLAKTDLTTELVKEFTELQGIVGGLYAQGAGSSIEILPEATRRDRDAIYDHYKPESMDDACRAPWKARCSRSRTRPTHRGHVCAGLIPSGSKDPFALRRAANGIVKIIAEHNLPLQL